MKFQVLAAAALASTAAAAPSLRYRQSNGTVTDGTPFNMVSIRSGSNLQYSPFMAKDGGLVLNAKDQGASCSNGAQQEKYATFFLKDGELNLYTPSNVTQKLFTDRSGMGQGILQYSTQPGGYMPTRNSETKGWAVDQVGDLTFDGAGMLACPSSGGAYSVWVSTGSVSPGGNSNCTGINVRTAVAPSPVACTYSFRPATK
jgi:hypothetical protein